MRHKGPDHQNTNDRLRRLHPALQLITQIAKISQEWHTNDCPVPDQEINQKIMCTTNPDWTLYRIGDRDKGHTGLIPAIAPPWLRLNRGQHLLPDGEP